MRKVKERATTAARTWDAADGRDEMNLVECPLSAVSDRFLDGRKTVVFQDQVWDPDRKAFLKRELAISGSDRYGLPTAKDEDVLLACVQLSSRQDFREGEVRFSRYELVKLLGWPDDGRSYNRISVSLRRWKGVTVYSDRAFYDHARKSWVMRDFGVFDNLSVYEREASERAAAPQSSWIVWNEVFFGSFRSGYLKKLDWELYCRLTDPVAKRLYRLLDKRFYHGPEVVFDLKELAVRKVRLSDSYDAGQMKRALSAGIRELKPFGTCTRCPPRSATRKVRRGEWQVVFGRKRAGNAPKAATPPPVDSVQVESLVTRGVNRAVAEASSAAHSANVSAAVKLFDTHNLKGRSRGAGFLVDAVRNPDKYRSDAEASPGRGTASRSASSERTAPRFASLSVRRTRRLSPKTKVDGGRFWNTGENSTSLPEKNSRPRQWPRRRSPRLTAITASARLAARPSHITAGSSSAITTSDAARRPTEQPARLPYGKSASVLA